MCVCVIHTHIHHIFTENVGWYTVKAESYAGMKDHCIWMPSRRSSLHAYKKAFPYSALSKCHKFLFK